MSQVKVTVTLTIKEHEIELTLDEAKQIYNQLGYVCEVKKVPHIQDNFYPKGNFYPNPLSPLSPLVSPLNPLTPTEASGGISDVWPKVKLSTNNKEI